ncbi:MAG: hypothetical protein RSC06_11490 [Clostridia bacterium]
MADRKIAAMHKAYGKDYYHKCDACCNLTRRRFGKTYFKCVAYGESNCSATDWNAGFPACGLFGKPFNGFRPMVEQLKRQPKVNTSEPVDGQIKMEV